MQEIPLRLPKTLAMPYNTFDIIIAGGGVGGCAAALAATNLGCSVLMTEETMWIGGQLTSQAVPPDENAWIESYGGTASYRRYRDLVRAYYKENYPLTFDALTNPYLNPGNGWVSGLCHEPRVSLAVLEQMLAPAQAAGLLNVQIKSRVVGCETSGDSVTSVLVENLETGEQQEYFATYFLDATELGDLLPLAGVEYVSGAESRSESGEWHAPEVADADNVQALTWCFPMAYDANGEHVIEKPAMYDFWRGYVPDLRPVPWPGPLLSFGRTNPFTMQPDFLQLMQPKTGMGWFTYRRILAASNFQPGTIPFDVSLVNWPQNDYLLTNIIDKPADIVAKAYCEAKQLSLSLLYWMQTEAPHFDDDGVGYPGLMLRPGMTGTPDGLAMAPYIRESRRIKAKFTVTEAHVGAEMLAEAGRTRAVEFPDSVGIGHYRIDLHPSTGGDNYIDIEAKSFQIPLSSLVPQRAENLIAACKNLGVTHITNGTYRLHPIEWNIGESAGYLAAWCTKTAKTPHQVLENAEMLTEFQGLIRGRGVRTSWPANHPA